MELVKVRWTSVTSWSNLIGKRVRITLISELSGVTVKVVETTLKEEWVSWLGPISRVLSLALTGLSVPLDGEIGANLGEAADTMNKLGDIEKSVEGSHVKVAENRSLHLTDAQMYAMKEFFSQLGLGAAENGMVLARVSDRRWLWMTGEEADHYVPTEAKLFV